MAYNGAYMSGGHHFGGGQAATMFIYNTTDAPVTWAASGYITDASLRGMKVGDFVLVCQVTTLPTTTPLGVTLAQVTAVTAGSSGTMTPVGLYTGIYTLTATTLTVTPALAGKTIVMSEPGGDAAVTITLPAATGSGAIYRFVVGVVNTSNYVIKVASASDTIDGTIHSTSDGSDNAIGWLADGTDDTITLNGTTTGGVTIGDWIELEDIASGQWAVRGQTSSSGTEATPFSATV